MNELQPLLDRLQGILGAMAPASRRELARQIATQLRASQAQRIKSNRDPDGQAYEPRKPQARLRQRRGQLRQQMFQKLTRLQWLKRRATADSATVEFVGQANRIARVSQYGLRDRVNKQGGMAQYPKRELLGLTKEEVNKIEDLMFGVLSR